MRWSHVVAACLCAYGTPGLRIWRGFSVRPELRKPLVDVRKYEHVTFDSGLRVLVVHDPDAEKTGFAMSVEAGSLEDPPEFQGLAHFCEHMLFLGSKKYPDEDEFSSHFALYGGSHNAYTSADTTVYFNEIGNDGVDRGLDIFAQFFITPSFREDMVDKEIHAVDSEHTKNKPNTQRRLSQLFRSKANPRNPMHQFATGDLSTLKTEPEKRGEDLVEALKRFHSANYCARRMHFVLVANKTTDELLNLAHSHFDDVPRATADTCPPRPVYTAEAAYSPEHGNLGWRYTVGTQGAPELWVAFPLPPLRTEYKKQPASYVLNALGNYGNKSLKAVLMDEDLSPSYSVYVDSSVAGSILFITFSLTSNGVEKADKILEHLFSYMKTVKVAGINMALLESTRHLNQVFFDYQEDTPSEIAFASDLAGSAAAFAPQDILTGGKLMDEVDENLIAEIIAAVNPDNMNVALVRKDFNQTAARRHEPYYDFNYDEAALEPTLLDRLRKAPTNGFEPPPDLRYVPRQLDVIAERAAEAEPTQLIGGGRVHSWWLGVGPVKLPKAVIMIKLGFPPATIGRVEDSVLASMHGRIVQRILERPVDGLLMCGLSYSVEVHNEGMQISFAGFDEHILELVKLVLPVVRSPEYAEEDFERVRRQLLIKFADVTHKQAYEHAMEAFSIVTVKGHYSRQELLRAANDRHGVSPSEHLRFLDDVFAEAQMSLLYAGNIGQERAGVITKEIEALLGVSRQQQEATHSGKLSIVKPSEEVEVRIRNPIPGDPNHATLVTYQFGIPSIADRAHLVLLGEIMERPVFETLRTEHQLGYVVFGYVAPHLSIVEVRVVVQGFREDPDVVDELIEDTVRNLTGKIASMDAQEFAQRKHSLRTALNKKEKTLSAFAGKQWQQIWDETYCFNKKKLLLRYLDSDALKTTAPLLDAWERTVLPSKHRKKIAVKLFGLGGATSLAAAPRDSHLKNITRRVLTLVDSASVEKSMEGEPTWPRECICKDEVAPLAHAPLVPFGSKSIKLVPKFEALTPR